MDREAGSIGSLSSSMFDDARRRGEQPPAGIAVGKRTLVEGLVYEPTYEPMVPGRGPVQRKPTAAGGDGPPGVGGAAAGAGGGGEGRLDALFGRPAGARPEATGTAPAASGGSALPAATLARMEQSFAADFSSVRVHQGGEAERIGAVAFARGSDLHFASGQYDPHGGAGQHLIAHELAHVVQQGEGRVAPTLQAKGLAINDDAGLEREADDCADRVARGEPARPAGAARVMARAAGDAPVQGFFRSNDFKAEHKDKQALFTTQDAQPTARASEDGNSVELTRGGGPVIASKVALRVADDLTMAIHDTEAEPKEFYASPEVIGTANAKLAETESSFRLDGAGGNSITVGPNQLAMVKPINQKAKDKGGGDGVKRFASLIRHLCIEMAGEVVGNGGQMSGYDVVLRNGERGKPITQSINPTPQKDDKVNQLGAHLATAGEGATGEDAQKAMTGKDKPAKDYARDYGQRQGRGEIDPHAQELGINQHAQPDVGEGFAIFSQTSDTSPNDDYAARDDGGAESRPNFWGYHFAGVVARSVQGDDRICLENYNRMPELKETAGAALLSLPKLAEQVRKHREKYPEDPLDDVVSNIVADNSAALDAWQEVLASSNAEQLWFFRMYGSREGQSFHEQQAADGGVVNPLTLHVRRSLDMQKDAKLALVEDNLQRYATALGSVKLSSSAAAKDLQAVVTALTQEGIACKALISGAEDNAALMAALRAVKDRFARFAAEDLATGLRTVYRSIVGDPTAGKDLDRKAMIAAIQAALKRDVFQAFGDFFAELADSGKKQKRESLEGLEAIFAALPETAFTEVTAASKAPDSKGTAFGKTDLTARFGGKDKDDKSLASSQLGLFLAMNNLQLQETVRDGDCLYDALRLQLHQVQDLAVETGALRTAVAALINANTVRFAPFLVGGVDAAVQRIMTARSWNNEAGDLAAQVIATVLQRDVIVLSPTGIDVRHPDTSLTRPPAALIASNGQALTIAYNGSDHYYSTSAMEG